MQFIQRKKNGEVFRFIAIQSDAGKELISKFDVGSVDTVILLEENKVFKFSTAVLRACGKLTFPWSMLKILLVIPVFLRDPVYRWVAANRHRFLRGSDACAMPSEKLK
jgi:predicted DCC family thiol-disulfide oxidoreductase YuxK